MRNIVAKLGLLWVWMFLSLSNSGFAADTILPKQVVIEQALAQVPGRVLAADLQQGQPPRYKVKVLRGDGRLKVLHINAKTGGLIRARKK